MTQQIARVNQIVAGILASALLATLTACTLEPTRQQAASSPVKITEVHFDPSPVQWQASFIEIANVTGAPVDVSGWQVTGAGRMTIPAATVLRPNDTVLFCKSLADVQKLASAKFLHVVAFQGKLRNSGETIRIEDLAGMVVDEVSYDPLVPTVKEAAGSGKSIHRADFAAHGGEAAWRVGAPSPGQFQAASSKTANR
jgi:hypothetical protein